MVSRYTTALIMAIDKTVALSFRVSPSEQHALSIPPAKIGRGKGGKK